MKILITGGAGTLGVNITDHLLQQGVEVAIVDNFSTSAPHRLDGLGKAKLFNGSVADFDFLAGALKDFQPTIVIHSAASYADPDDWMSDIDTNIIGAVNLSKICQQQGIENILNFQTALCYGNPISSPLKIDHPVQPQTSYAISKVAAEQYLMSSELNVTSLRIANVASPHLSIGPIPTFYKRLKAGQGCFCTDAKRDFLSFRDFMAFVDCVLQAPFKSTIYNIASGKGHTIHDVYEAVALHLGLDPKGVEVRPCGDDDVQEVVLDPSEAEKDFGWKARDDFQTVIRQQLEWYDQNGVGEIYSHLKK
ncbi:MAG: NAD-dependent epimerase/dehydratase family protein [Parvibaculales bacterium]